MDTIDGYLRQRQIDLAQSIAGRTKVYLDLRYWIIARDAAAGIRTGASSRKLLHFLRRGVANGTLICPISTSTFLELMKQPHSETRRIGTARLIDELSLGVTMQPSRTVMGTEIHSTFLINMGRAVYDMQELIWTKVAYVLVPVHPTLPHLDALVELQIQKAFVDKMWEQTLTDMVLMIGDVEDPEEEEGWEAIAARLDRENAAHADNIRSFEMTYRAELKGMADACAPMAAEIGAHLENRASQAAQQHDWHVQTWMARILIAEMMSRVETRGLLRSLCINAALYAASRWDKQRRFKANDLYDFDHSVCALGYCDAFLTEGPLHHLTAEPRLALTQINNCRIVSDLDEAVDFLRAALIPTDKAR
jgi:hypothetical protein